MQKLAVDQLLSSSFTGDVLIVEALLRRGFLAFQDSDGVWLGTGSHQEDVSALAHLPELKLTLVQNDRKKLARIEASHLAKNAAASIISLPENNFRWTGMGIGRYISPTWHRYKTMVWGAKLATSPIARSLHQDAGQNGLDTGIALLVKTLPLAGVATGYSCDGHGKHPAEVSFFFKWDLPWARLVYLTLATPSAKTRWSWNQDHGNVSISPAEGFNDAALLEMFFDIQCFARCLLIEKNIEMVRHARRETIESFSHLKNGPSKDAFEKAAQKFLIEAFTC